MDSPAISPVVLSEPPPLPQPRFSLGAPSLVVLGVTAVLTLLLSVLRGPHDARTIVSGIGSFAIIFLFAMGLAWVAWRLDARRRAGGLVFCFVMGLFLFGKLVVPIVDHANVARRTAQLHELQRESIAQQERELARRGGTASAKKPDASAKTDSERLQQRVQVFQDASREAQGDDRRMLEVDAFVMAGFQANVKVNDDATAALKADGFISAVGLDTREGLARRKALLLRCAQTNAALAEATRILGDRLYAEMRRNLPEPRATDAAERAMRGFDTLLLLRVREGDRLMIEAADGIVALFDRESGRWHFNASKRVVFDDADAPASYARWIKQIQDAEHEEESVQRELLARAKARLGH